MCIAAWQRQVFLAVNAKCTFLNRNSMFASAKLCVTQSFVAMEMTRSYSSLAICTCSLFYCCLSFLFFSVLCLMSFLDSGHRPVLGISCLQFIHFQCIILREIKKKKILDFFSRFFLPIDCINTLFFLIRSVLFDSPKKYKYLTGGLTNLTVNTTTQ